MPLFGKNGFLCKFCAAIIVIFGVIVAAMVLRMFFSGVPALRADNTIFFVSLTSLAVVCWTFPTSMPKTREILIFLLCEIASFASVILFLIWFWNIGVVKKRLLCNEKFAFVGIVAASQYPFVLFPLMTSVIHSISIYHLIRGTESKGARINAVIRAIYCFVGLIVLYFTMVMTLFLPTEMNPIIVYLYTAQVCLIFTVNYTATELDRGQVTKTVDSWTHLSTNFPYYRRLTLIPLIGSIIIIAIKKIYLEIYGGTDICDEANEMLEQSKSFLLRLGHILVRILSTPKEEQNPFENESLSRYLSYSAWGILSLGRYLYIQGGAAALNLLNVVQLLLTK